MSESLNALTEKMGFDPFAIVGRAIGFEVERRRWAMATEMGFYDGAPISTKQFKTTETVIAETNEKLAILRGIMARLEQQEIV